MPDVVEPDEVEEVQAPPAPIKPTVAKSAETAPKTKAEAPKKKTKFKAKEDNPDQLKKKRSLIASQRKKTVRWAKQKSLKATK